jgi:hypothetical protein
MTLTMPGRAEAFYTTRNQVREARLFAPSPGRTQTVVALWNERDARGVERPARAYVDRDRRTTPADAAAFVHGFIEHVISKGAGR